MKVTCDKCHKAFDCLLQTRVEGNITIAFLLCPVCGEEYISYYDNEYTKELKEQLKALSTSVADETDEKEKLRKWKKFKRKQNQLKVANKKLESKYRRNKQ